jgi:hypothetical protein
MLISSTWFRLKWITDRFLIVIPISLTYAVLKHRLLDIHLVVRRSLKYLMARRVLQLIVIMPFLGLILPIALNPNRTLLESLRQDRATSREPANAAPVIEIFRMPVAPNKNGTARSKRKGRDPLFKTAHVDDLQLPNPKVTIG